MFAYNTAFEELACPAHTTAPLRYADIATLASS